MDTTITPDHTGTQVKPHSKKGWRETKTKYRFFRIEKRSDKNKTRECGGNKSQNRVTHIPKENLRRTEGSRSRFLGRTNNSPCQRPCNFGIGSKGKT